MMYRVLLNGTEIKEPQGLNSLVLNKVLSEVFNGFIIGEFGLADQTDGLTFVDKESVGIIQSILETNSINDSVAIEIYYCEKLLYSGKLDISTLSITDCCNISCSIAKDDSGDLINSKKEIKYALTPNRKIFLPKKEFIEGGSYEVGDRKSYTMFVNNGIVVNHNVPLKSDGKLSGMQNELFAYSCFYQSPGNNDLVINGVISWNAITNVSYDLVMEITDSVGTVLSSNIIGSYEGNNSTVTQRAIVSEKVSLTNGQRVSFKMTSLLPATQIGFTYSNDTYIEIAQKTIDQTESNSSCFGFLAYDAFRLLLERLSSKTIQFKSDFFKTGLGKNDFITNGNNIRNIFSTINLDLAWLFAQFDKLYDLECGFENDVFWIEQKKETYFNGTYLNTESINNYKKSVDASKLYSSVKVGFNNWEAENKLKGAEYNSGRQYETNLIFGSNELDLTNDLIASGFLIEEQRRIQYDAEKKNAEANNDENIFIIAVDGDYPESISNYNPISNLLTTGGVYNLKYTPVRILNYNKLRLSHLGELRFTSGDGNYSLTSKGISENETLNFGSKIPYIVEFESVLEFSEFAKLETLNYSNCGMDEIIKITEASLEPQQNGNGFITIKGELL